MVNSSTIDIPNTIIWGDILLTNIQYNTIYKTIFYMKINYNTITIPIFSLKEKTQ